MKKQAFKTFPFRKTRPQYWAWGPSLVVFGALFLSVSAHAQGPGRFPATYVQSDMDPTPDMLDEQPLVEDDSGVLDSMRQNFNRWQNQETYADQWNLESTGLFVGPDEGQKKSYFQRMMLKYIDKRFSGELKRQQEDPSTGHHGLQQVATINNVIQPSGGMNMGQGVKLKLRARPIQGRVFLLIQNPIMDYETKVSLDGRVIMSANRSIDFLGVKAGVNYDMHYHAWEAHVDKTLTETLMARASSSGQSDRVMAFENGSNQTYQLIYSTPF